jgi:hypothetical protein
MKTGPRPMFGHLVRPCDKVSFAIDIHSSLEIVSSIVVHSKAMRNLNCYTEILRERTPVGAHAPSDMKGLRRLYRHWDWNRQWDR